MTNSVQHNLNEKKVLQDSHHPFVVQLQYAFQDDYNVYLVLEYMPGGVLFYHLK